MEMHLQSKALQTELDFHKSVYEAQVNYIHCLFQALRYGNAYMYGVGAKCVTIGMDTRFLNSLCKKQYASQCKVCVCVCVCG